MKTKLASQLTPGDEVVEESGMLFDVVRVARAGERVAVTLKSDFRLSCRGEQVVTFAADAEVACRE
jgi:preprotein translocase subunit YajC